jgi:hypothetical protein
MRVELREEELLLLEEVLREEMDQLIESVIYGPADPEEALERLVKLIRLARKLWGGEE